MYGRNARTSGIAMITVKLCQSVFMLATLLTACSSGGVPAEQAHRPKAAVEYVLRNWYYVDAATGIEYCRIDNGETVNDVLIGVRRDRAGKTGFLCGKPMQLGQPVRLGDEGSMPDAVWGSIRSCARDVGTDYQGVMIGMLEVTETNLGSYRCARMFDRWGQAMVIVDKVSVFRTRDPAHVFQCPIGVLLGSGVVLVSQPTAGVEWVYECGQVF